MVRWTKFKPSDTLRWDGSNILSVTEEACPSQRRLGKWEYLRRKPRWSGFPLLWKILSYGPGTLSAVAKIWVQALDLEVWCCVLECWCQGLYFYAVELFSSALQTVSSATELQSVDADSLHSAAETSVLIHGIIAFWYGGIKFGTEVLGSETEMVGYGLRPRIVLPRS